jgi:hypothetical protein
MSPIIEALDKAEELIRHHVGETPEGLETLEAIERARRADPVTRLERLRDRQTDPAVRMGATLALHDLRDSLGLRGAL